MKTIDTCFIEMALCYIHDNRGKWRVIAEETGLGYEWINKFSQGKFADPGARKIETLLRHGGFIKNDKIISSPGHAPIRKKK